MRQVKRVLSFHLDDGRSGRSMARHCGMAQRSVWQTLERFAVSGLDRAQARDLSTTRRWRQAHSAKACHVRMNSDILTSPLPRSSAV